MQINYNLVEAIYDPDSKVLKCFISILSEELEKPLVIYLDGSEIELIDIAINSILEQNITSNRATFEITND